MLVSLFLFLMSSLSPRRKPSFFILRHFSVSLLLLSRIVTSILYHQFGGFLVIIFFILLELALIWFFCLWFKRYNYQHMVTHLVGLNVVTLANDR